MIFVHLKALAGAKGNTSPSEIWALSLPHSIDELGDSRAGFITPAACNPGTWGYQFHECGQPRVDKPSIGSLHKLLAFVLLTQSETTVHYGCFPVIFFTYLLSLQQFSLLPSCCSFLIYITCLTVSYLHVSLLLLPLF